LPVCCLTCYSSTASADDWPQWRGIDRDGVWHETGVIDSFDSPRLPLRWRAEISSGYCGPTVAGGRVYVTDRVIKPKQIERVHCFDAKDGTPLWTHAYDCAYRGVEYDAGPRASVTIDDRRAYSLGTMGHLHCFDAATGKVEWSHDLGVTHKIRMPMWGIAGSPLVEGDLVIVHIGGEPNACLVAFDKKTGTERWRALDDPASYSSPIVIDQAGRRVLVCWTGRRVVGLGPATGKLHWSQEFTPARFVRAIARRRRESAVRLRLFRRLAHDAARSRPTRGAESVAASRSQRARVRRLAHQHLHLLLRRRSPLRRRQLRRTALSRREHG
jgi:hypothetical protein